MREIIEAGYADQARAETERRRKANEKIANARRKKADAARKKNDCESSYRATIRKANQTITTASSALRVD